MSRHSCVCILWGCQNGLGLCDLSVPRVVFRLLNRLYRILRRRCFHFLLPEVSATITRSWPVRRLIRGYRIWSPQEGWIDRYVRTITRKSKIIHAFPDGCGWTSQPKNLHRAIFKHSPRRKNPGHRLWVRLCCDLRASFDLGGIGCGMEIYWICTATVFFVKHF